MEIKDPKVSQSDSSINAFNHISMQLVALLVIIKEIPSQKDPTRLRLILNKYRELKKIGESFIEKELGGQLDSQQDCGQENLQGLFAMSNNTIFIGENQLISEEKVNDYEDLTGENQSVINSHVEFQRVTSSILFYLNNFVEDGLGRNDYLNLLENLRKEQKEGTSEKQQNQDFVRSHLCQIEASLKQQQSYLASLSQKLHDYEKEVLAKKNFLLAPDPLSHTRNSQQKENKLQCESHQEEGKQNSKKQEVGTQTIPQTFSSASKADQLLEKICYGGFVRSQEVFRNEPNNQNSFKGLFLNSRRNLVQAGNLMYGGNVDGNVQITDLNTLATTRLNINQQELLNAIHINNTYAFLSTQRNHLLVFAIKNNFKQIRNKAFSSNVLVMVEWDSGNVLLGMQSGDLQMLNLQTFAATVVVQTLFFIFEDVIKCKQKDEIAIVGSKGVIFGKVLKVKANLIKNLKSSLFGGNSECYDFERSPEKKYFENRHISTIVEYSANKFCVSLNDESKELVGLIDREKKQERIIFHPFNRVDRASSVQLINGNDFVALIRTRNDIFIFNFKTDYITHLVKIQTQKFKKLICQMPLEQGLMKEIKGTKTDELLLYVVDCEANIVKIGIKSGDEE